MDGVVVYKVLEPPEVISVPLGRVVILHNDCDLAQDFAVRSALAEGQAMDESDLAEAGYAGAVSDSDSRAERMDLSMPASIQRIYGRERARNAAYRWNPKTSSAGSISSKWCRSSTRLARYAPVTP